MNQQEFLREAMAELGRLNGEGRPATRDEFCERLGCPRPTFDKWMVSSEHGREMPNQVWCHIREVLAHEKLKMATGRSLA